MCKSCDFGGIVRIDSPVMSNIALVDEYSLDRGRCVCALLIVATVVES